VSNDFENFLSYLLKEQNNEQVKLYLDDIDTNFIGLNDHSSPLCLINSKSVVYLLDFFERTKEHS
jgi:hypothetical protein